MINKVLDKYRLYNGDCLEVLDRLIKEGVKLDCIITDPPYGINYRSNFKKSKFNKIQNDNTQQIEYIKKCSDLLNDGKAIYIYCRWDCFNEVMEEVKKYFTVKNCLVWYKKGGGLGDLKGSYIYNHEFIIFATKGRHILNGKRSSDVLEFSKENTSRYLHPTQKPTKLIEHIINKSTNENDVILDCFMGSGSTGVACMNTNRKFIGIELDKNYFNIAKERIEEACK